MNIKLNKIKISLGGIIMAKKILDVEMIAMTLIGYAGETKSLAYQAMSVAKEGKFDEAEELMRQATEEMLKAHELQTDLIVREAGGEKLDVGLIMVHSQDHLMTAILFKELAKEFIDIYKRLAQK